LRVIRHCCEKTGERINSSDVGYPRLSLEEFADLTQYVKENIAYNTVIEAIYP